MEETQRKQRVVLHIDLDAYYASIEQRDHPELRGKPVVVGRSPQSRGVVATCSYEARAFGVRSAMPAKTAYRLCPQAIFLPPRFDVYRAVSAQILAIFKSITVSRTYDKCTRSMQEGLQPVSLETSWSLPTCLSHRSKIHCGTSSPSEDSLSQT